MRPLDIEILLSVYVCGLLPERMRGKTHFHEIHATLNDLENQHLIRATARQTAEGHQEYEATGRLIAYMEALQALRLPVQKWVVPDENN